ncbi:MAG: hypothetical protein AB1641_09770 [Thermodesulfobacteriota bacterium]
MPRPKATKYAPLRLAFLAQELREIARKSGRPVADVFEDLGREIGLACLIAEPADAQESGDMPLDQKELLLLRRASQLGLIQTVCDMLVTSLTPEEVERRIIEGMVRVEPKARTRALVSIRDLRQIAYLPKPIFDAAVLDLAAQGVVVLHYHDFPASLSDQEREALVQDSRGTYYVGIVFTEQSCASA